MRGLAPKLLALTIALLALLAVAAPALAAPAITGRFALEESEIETNNKIVEGQDHNMWLTTGNAAKPVGQVTPAGLTAEIEIGAGVKKWFGIAPGPDGDLWVTFEGGVAKFAAGDPKGTFKEFSIATVKANASIVAGPDGNMWVATEGNVVRFSTSDPEKTAKPFAIAKLSPKDIDVAGSLLVIADFEPRIVTVNTDGTLNKEYPIDGGSQGVAGGANGLVGFSQQTKMPEQVGLISPPANPQVFTQEGDPFGVAYGSDAAFWVVRSGVDGVARLSTSGQITQLSGFPAGSMPRQIASGPSNTMWVTLTNPGKKGEVGRISGLEPPPPPAPPAPPSGSNPAPPPSSPPPAAIPNTLLGKKPKSLVRTREATAQVKFSFSAIGSAAGFECSLAHRVRPPGKGQGKKGAKIRFVGGKFHACKSPKTYTVKPGPYRFQVRAVSTAGHDSSPAQYNFRVVYVISR